MLSRSPGAGLGTTAPEIGGLNILRQVGVSKVGEAALAKSGAATQATRKAGQEKLNETQTEGVLAISETEPTATDLKLLETILLTQMRQDQQFAEQLQALNQQIQAQTLGLQAVLDRARVKGNGEVGNVEQVSETGVTNKLLIATEAESTAA